ncbi:MAG: type II secretion system ATPase GspE [Planctomycetota bacterium]|nr:type II secretion system ATPase GspE [Planctomycetota bacterium]
MESPTESEVPAIPEESAPPPETDLIAHLVEEGLIDRRAAEECRRLELETGDLPDRILKSKGYLSEDGLLRVFHRRFGIPYLATLHNCTVPKDFVRLVPAQFARFYNLIGIEEDNGTYRVATCSPLDIHPVDDLASLLDSEVEVALSPRSEITALINKAYQKSVDGVDEMLEGVDEEELSDLPQDITGTEDILDIANKAPIIKLVNTILFEALKLRASDIHLQPFEDRLVVRYRIDGILYDMKVIPKRVQDAIISRVKVMGKMDIAERRLPQDGRATVKVGDGEVDIRLSSVPTSHGERIVFRLLDKSAKVYQLTEIGLSEANRNALAEIITYTHGIIFVTGPTGSGKTTTLYAVLTQLNSAEKNVITIEDPIEYHLEGVSQIQVSEKKGLTFASGLRSLLRQDPDVMMVGEVRDEETARIAIQAALTGHLVFSTMHTNDSAGAVTRMLDIKVEPYLVASSLIAVIAQRLVRRICVECRKESKPTDEELHSIGLKLEQVKGGLLWTGEGCETCLDTGYRERTAIYEILSIGDRVRQQVMDHKSASDIKRLAVENGLVTLRMDGARKVLEGQTTVDEVLRVTQMDIV